MSHSWKEKRDQKICKKLRIWRMHKNGTADEHNEPASVPENSRLERNNREPPLWLQEIADPLMDLKQGMETLRVNKTFRGILSTLLSIGIFLNGNEVGIECQPNDIRLIRQSESVVRAESISISVDDFRVIVVRWFGKRDEYRFKHFPWTDAMFLNMSTIGQLSRCCSFTPVFMDDGRCTL